MKEQWRLGQLIDALEKRKRDEETGAPQRVVFDFCGVAPVGCHSYRGFYDHLALDPAEVSLTSPAVPTVDSVLAMLRNALKDEFCGWKGGNYRMRRETPLWVDQRGEANGTAIVGIADCDWLTIIETKWMEFAG